MTQPLPCVDTFTDFWQLYKQTSPRDLITTNVVVGGRAMSMPQVLGHFFSDAEVLDESVRREIVRELTTFRPAMIDMGGSSERDPSYWRERIWRVSQAARALKPLVERKAVQPGRYTSPPG